MPVTVRADLAQMPDYVAGLKLPGAIVLSSNEVSTPTPASVLEAIAAAASQVNRYPAKAADDLVARTSTYLGVDQQKLAVGCGSVSLCQQLVQAMCTDGQEVVFPWRSFEAYPIVTQIAGARGVKVPLTPEHSFDLDAITDAITDQTRVLFIANPNNPTGTALRTAELTHFLDRVPDDVLVVLDEAYREFVTDPDVPDGLEAAGERPNVVVLRTLSKAWGLAGIRVGWLSAPEPVADAVRKVLTPFSVSAVAQAAALAALQAREEMQRRVDVIIGERGRVARALQEVVPGVPETQANFVWLPLADASVPFAAACEARGVIVRPFPGDGVRVTIGTPAENDAFLAAAAAAPR